MVAWLIRGVLALGILVVGALALGSRSPAAPSASTGAPAALPAPTAAVAPAPPVAVVPTPTAEGFVQRVVSRVARQTQAPFPTSTPLPDGAALVSIVDFGYMPGTMRTGTPRSAARARSRRTDSSQISGWPGTA